MGQVVKVNFDIEMDFFSSSINFKLRRCKVMISSFLKPDIYRFEVEIWR